MSVIRTVLRWIVPVFMVGLLAATIGLLAYLVISAGGAQDSASNVVGIVVTLLVWVWGVRLLIRRVSQA